MDGAGGRAGRIACGVRVGAAERVAAVWSTRGRCNGVCGIDGDHLPGGFCGMLHSIAESDADRPYRGTALRIGANQNSCCDWVQVNRVSEIEYEKENK